jgi:hypothetical protein
MRNWLTRGAVGVAVAAGATGLGLGAAGVRSPLRTALVLLFLVVAPTAAVAGLLRGFDYYARLILAFATTIVILTLTSVIMLMAGVWSPAGGLLAVAGITAACTAAQLPPARRALSAREPAGRSGS